MKYEYKKVRDRYGIVCEAVQFDGTNECLSFIKETTNWFIDFDVSKVWKKGDYIIKQNNGAFFYYPSEMYNEKFIDIEKTEEIDYEAKDRLYGSWKEFCVICQEFKKVAKKAMDKNKHKHKFTDSDFEGSDMLFHKLTRFFLGNPEHQDTLDDMVGYLQLMIKNRREKNNTTINQDSFEKELNKERNLNVYKGRIIGGDNNVFKLQGVELDVEYFLDLDCLKNKVNQEIYFLGDFKGDKIKFIAELDPQFMDLEDFRKKLLKNKPDRLDGINHE